MKLIHEIETSFRVGMLHDISRLERELSKQLEFRTAYLNLDRHFVRVIVKGGSEELIKAVVALINIGALDF